MEQVDRFNMDTGVAIMYGLKLTFHNAQVLNLIFQAQSHESYFKIGRGHLHRAGGQVQLGHQGCHHVGVNKLSFHNAHVINLIFQARFN